MAKNNRLSLLQIQKAKLKKQRALAKTPKAKAIVDRRIQRVTVQIENTQKQLKGASANKALPPSKKGGAIKSTRGPRRTNVNKPPKTKPQVGTKGGGVKPQLRLPPGGKTAANLLKNNAVTRSAGGKLGGIGLALSGIATAQDLAASLKRGEGYASLPKLVKAIAKGKPKKTTGGDTNRRGRNTSKPTNSTNNPNSGSKPRVSNIPKSEGTGKRAERNLGYGAGAKKPTTKPSSGSTTPTSKSNSKPKSSAPKPQAKSDNRSTLTKEIAGLSKFLATHKGKKGMERALKQASESLAIKKRKKERMSGNTLSNRDTA